MLEIKNIGKVYHSEDFKQTALNNVSISFRENEFVSILGPSGSGKTTLLNIIGGLDKFTSGDLIINGKSTKKYSDRDWDTYRNHSIGFVFQSYNLIPHQNILANVELALTLSGVQKSERRKKALEALKKVGLEDHIKKRPNQLSGGQMQRVAIARALVNNPDILLADEPTGALDSKTSKQIMDLLKEVAKDRLVIMVTHNKELAEEYSTRIIELRDGKVIGDTMPFDIVEEKSENIKAKRTSMSYKTALSLSLNNLMTKKGRTILTAFAGSIGIIGIALILSLSSGVQDYIDRVQEETLTSYPLTIESTTIDMTSAMMQHAAKIEESQKNKNENKIYSNDRIGDILSIMSNQIQSNNLEQFKNYIESKESNIKEYVSEINYEYNLDLQLFTEKNDKILQVNPNTVLTNLGLKEDSVQNMMIGKVWNKLFTNDKLNKQLYQIVSGRMPEKYNEVVVMVDENNQVSDYALYALGLKDQEELKKFYKDITEGKKIEIKSTSYNYDEIVGLEFKLLLNSDYYDKVNNIWTYRKEDNEYLKQKLKTAETIKVVGIIKSNEDATVSQNTMGGVFYLDDLEKYVIEKNNTSEIVKAQKENPEINVITGLKFTDEEFSLSNLSKEQQIYLQSLSPEELAALINRYKEQADSTYESVLKELGAIDLNKPSKINIYPNDFESKEQIATIIEEYNQKQEKNGQKENVINYTDVIGLLMSSVTVIVDMISYVLIGFVSISLIVSSIMIGIITYISVLERTKEIGILRAIGASKKDVSRVFNAETLIVGATAGVIGIIMTIIINIPINIIINHLANVENLSKLPLIGGVSLIIISIVLTIIAGLIPARIASKKDPVESLRTE